ncbi:hypothetical protein ACKI1P_07690 [Streptomyces turgidiscabies]|uniref:hypothetical protein n=1 Tax=Streptomyces turgidiscabies TaxID=85558 RepID=UPI0038F73063
MASSSVSSPENSQEYAGKASRTWGGQVRILHAVEAVDLGRDADDRVEAMSGGQFEAVERARKGITGEECVLLIAGEAEGTDGEVLVVGVTAAQLEQPLPVGGQRPREVDSGSRRPVPTVRQAGKRLHATEARDYGANVHESSVITYSAA